jgi:hypothetical protein
MLTCTLVKWLALMIAIAIAQGLVHLHSRPSLVMQMTFLEVQSISSNYIAAEFAAWAEEIQSIEVLEGNCF